ncbi:MAG TPA: TetR/AcrR family transcriptional regulator [Erwinia persicina]|nr:TetR/AcrR family transcriptional regulator [Erwinia persicina]HBH65082.1 TetR/AcrR family transcriptional regulator [Erwinia persicina]HBI06266.1 TetR/AcrR family transcriptional regulator [Erwinia persicina]HBQ78073.1 TetR/AcrR family transcriptional regulator [Erwinia persicina]HBT14580.1 TetR/AcrR family transcriptional regulator [Erwinia persicina]
MRQHIIDVARAIITHKGYSAVGIAEIVQAAGIPKGSFYYYFKSKEEFAEALLEHYFSHYLSEVDIQLNGSGPARERLLRYFTFWKTTQGADLPESKCLVVKLGAEVCDQYDSMRYVLAKGTQDIVQKIAQCIREGQQDRSLPAVADAGELAEELYQLWLGASLMAKIHDPDKAFGKALNATLRLLG